MKVRLGQNVIEVLPLRTVTYFADGSSVQAAHQATPKQETHARELGYDSGEAMNREHDIAHSLLAKWLGLDYSPTLFAIAHGVTSLHWREEEAAVLAIQKFARKVNVSLLAQAILQDEGDE